MVAVDEPQGGRVHAVPQPALVARPIWEDVAKVAVAVLGADLGPCYAVRAVNVLDDVRGLEGPRETRPSRPAVELVEGCEERLAGNHVDIETRLLVVPVFVGEGALGPVSLRDAVLLGSQLRDRFGIFRVGRHSRYSFLFCIEDRHRAALGAPGRRVEVPAARPSSRSASCT